MSKKYTLLTFKGICMNFLLELKFFILSHPVTSKQPHKIVQIHMVYFFMYLFLSVGFPFVVSYGQFQMTLILTFYMPTIFIVTLC